MSKDLVYKRFCRRNFGLQKTFWSAKNFVGLLDSRQFCRINLGLQNICRTTFGLHKILSSDFSITNDFVEYILDCRQFCPRTFVLQTVLLKVSWIADTFVEELLNTVLLSISYTNNPESYCNSLAFYWIFTLFTCEGKTDYSMWALRISNVNNRVNSLMTAWVKYIHAKCFFDGNKTTSINNVMNYA